MIPSCFRPLTGILFFNKRASWNGESVPVFPSPYGDFVFQLLHSLRP